MVRLMHRADQTVNRKPWNTSSTHTSINEHKVLDNSGMRERTDREREGESSDLASLTTAIYLHLVRHNVGSKYFNEKNYVNCH